MKIFYVQLNVRLMGFIWLRVLEALEGLGDRLYHLGRCLKLSWKVSVFYGLALLEGVQNMKSLLVFFTNKLATHESNSGESEKIWYLV